MSCNFYIYIPFCILFDSLFYYPFLTEDIIGFLLLELKGYIPEETPLKE